MPQDLFVNVGQVPPGGDATYVLTKRTDSDFDLEWQPSGGAGSGITELTGDVSAGPGFGSQAATVNSVGGVSASDISTLAPLVLNNSPNTMAGFSSVGTLEAIAGFSIDTTSGGMNINLTENPDDGGGFTMHTWSAGFEPLQNSPNENWLIHNFNINIDPTSTGFTFGTNGDAITILNGGFNHQGTSDVGRLRYINLNSNLGNGTDPFTINGMAMVNALANVAANITLNGNIQGYGLQLAVNNASLSTSNFSLTAFSDFSQVPITLYGYTGFNASPNISEIANNNNFTAFATGSNVTTFTGNANFTGLGIYPNITTMSATGSFQAVTATPAITTASNSISGFNFSPSIAGGTFSNFDGLIVQPQGASSAANVRGVRVALSSITSTDPQGAIGIESDSRIGINGTTQLQSAQGFQIGSRLAHLFTVPNGSPVTGTDELGVNIAGDFLVQDDVANGAFGIGFNSVGFIASLGVAATKTVDSITVFLPACALPDPGFTTGGSCTEFHHIRVFPPLPQGGTLNVTNLYAFKLDSLFGSYASAATNAYGLYLDGGAIKNWVSGRTRIGGSTYVTPTDALEVEGNVAVLTAGNGLKLTEGTNAKMGQATLVGGTVTVANTSVTANSRIFVTANSTSTGHGSLWVDNIVAATSFDINSTNVLDDAVVSYLIIEAL